MEGDFWDVLAEAGGSLVLTREYEHLVVALHVVKSRPRVSYLRLPHPNGIAVDVARGSCSGLDPEPEPPLRARGRARLRSRHGAALRGPSPTACLPVRSLLPPGCLYLHDLAFIGRELHATGGRRSMRWSASDLGRLSPGLVAEVHRRPRRPALRAQLPPAQLHRGRSEPDAQLLHGFRRPALAAVRAISTFPSTIAGVVFSGRTREVVATGLTAPALAALPRGVASSSTTAATESSVAWPTAASSRSAGFPGWTRGSGFRGHGGLRGHEPGHSTLSPLRPGGRARPREGGRARGRASNRSRPREPHLAARQPDLRPRGHGWSRIARLFLQPRRRPARGRPGLLLRAVGSRRPRHDGRACRVMPTTPRGQGWRGGRFCRRSWTAASTWAGPAGGAARCDAWVP